MSLKLFRDSGSTFPARSAIPLKQWRFPAGEVGVKIEVEQWNLMHECAYQIHLNWEGNDDLFALAQLVEALRGFDATEIELYIPYFPYARQDRRCQLGEGHALKMAATFINSLNFDRVIVDDPHSYVVEAVLERATFTPQAVCATRLPKYDYFIAPDAGAAKKIYTHRQVTMDRTKVLVADKTRDEKGNITGMVLHGAEQLLGKTACVVDDICDGGATFLAVAYEVLQPQCRPSKLDLYVTHGIYTKGLGELAKCYSTFYTANLMNPALKGHVKEI